MGGACVVVFAEVSAFSLREINVWIFLADQAFLFFVLKAFFRFGNRHALHLIGVVLKSLLAADSRVCNVIVVNALLA